MTVTLIVNVVSYPRRSVFGKEFQSSNLIVCDSTRVVGRETWDSWSILEKSSHKTIVITSRPAPETSIFVDVEYMTFEGFVRLYSTTPGMNVNVIASARLFYGLLSDNRLDVERIHVLDSRVVTDLKLDDFEFTIPGHFKVVYISEPQLVSIPTVQNAFQYSRRIMYKSTKGRPYPLASKTGSAASSEQKYLDLLKQVLESGEDRADRTGTGTRSIFSKEIVFDVSETVPILTTKRIPWKHCIKELLWFLRGDTDSKILNSQGVKIWNDNTSKSFLEASGLDYPEGILGPGYGWQWRFYGASYSADLSDTSLVDTKSIGGVDQIEYIINEIKNNPTSRRILMSAWNPTDLDKTALVPCFVNDSLVLNGNGGYTPIQDIVKGDLVYTHKSHAREVKDIHHSLYTGVMYSVYTNLSEFPVVCTGEHPFLKGSREDDKDTFKDVWTNAQNLVVGDTLADLPVISSNYPDHDQVGDVQDSHPGACSLQTRSKLELVVKSSSVKGQVSLVKVGQFRAPTMITRIVTTHVTDEPVYNLEVDEDNSYIVQGLSVHNCHYSVQFYTRGDDLLDLKYNMRSSDTFLGLPWNILSYTVLLYIIAARTNRKPGRVVFSGADVHIYKTHLDQVKLQLSRQPGSEPVLLVNKSVATKPLDTITVNDFDVVGYYPQESIAGKMAV